MYIPRHYVADPIESAELLSQMKIGQLVTATEQGPLATLLPWVPDVENGRLISHMARANEQWHTPWLGQALVISEGPHGYVSPTWYASTLEHGRVVPTWDYVILQVHGDLVIHEGASWLGEAVRRVTDLHEQERSEPWSVDDAPTDYIDGQLRAIVGIELCIERVECSIKMSQNKSDADAAGVVAGFTTDQNDAVAQWVLRARSGLA